MTPPRPHVVFCYRFGVLGGVVSQLRNRLRAFEEHYRVSFLFREDNGVTRFLPADQVRIVEHHSDAVTALHELAPDVVAVVDSPWFLPAWRDAGRPGELVLEVHTTTYNIRYLEQLTPADGIGRIITVSDYMRRRLEASPVSRLAPVHVVPNCLDDHWYQSGPVPQVGRPPVLWVGKLDGHKRFRTAVLLLQELVEDRPDRDVVPLFIGGYTAGPDNFRAMAMQLTRSRALREAVWWPLVPYERMPPVLRGAAASGGVKLVTSADESFGMSVAEAIVSGCPVVAPRVGALPEILPQAALYEPGDRAGALRLLHRSIDDGALRTELLSTADKVRGRTAPATTLRAFRRALGHQV